jgi:hypothetical protein
VDRVARIASSTVPALAAEDFDNDTARVTFEIELPLSGLWRDQRLIPYCPLYDANFDLLTRLFVEMARAVAAGVRERHGGEATSGP